MVIATAAPIEIARARQRTVICRSLRRLSLTHLLTVGNTPTRTCDTYAMMDSLAWPATEGARGYSIAKGTSRDIRVANRFEIMRVVIARSPVSRQRIAA